MGVLAPAAIGDTVLASGLIQDLAGVGARITVIASPANAGVVPLLPGVHGHLTIPITRPDRALAAVRSADFDVVVDITPWPRINAVLAGLSGASLTVGFRTEGQHRHVPFDVRVPFRHDLHQSVNYAQLVSALGVEPRARPRLALPPGVVVEGLPARFVVFHAWPGGYRSTFKEWPQHAWCALGERVRDAGLTVVLTGGKADRARSAVLSRALAAVGVEVRDLAGATSLTECAALLDASLAVISVDTGLMHVAGALDVPTLGLHGPTRARRWGAVGAHVLSLDAPGEDAGFLSLGFEYPREPPDCMARLDVERVWNGLTALLARERALSRARAQLEAIEAAQSSLLN